MKSPAENMHWQNAGKDEDRKLWQLLATVADPEIPVLTVLDLGIVREVQQDGDTVVVSITPTYSGCPAMDTIADDINKVLREAGYKPQIKTVLAPAWSSEWMSEEGRQKLEAYGVAAPLSATADKRALLEGERIVKCPRCRSQNTRMISQFGSTACKAFFQCDDCLEPFDYFKCI